MTGGSTAEHVDPELLRKAVKHMVKFSEIRDAREQSLQKLRENLGKARFHRLKRGETKVHRVFHQPEAGSEAGVSSVAKGQLKRTLM